MKARKSRAIIAIALATAVFGATPAFAGVTINGSGATFAGPLDRKSTRLNSSHT